MDTKSYAYHQRKNTRRLCDWQIGVYLDTGGKMVTLKISFL